MSFENDAELESFTKGLKKTILDSAKFSRILKVCTVAIKSLQKNKVSHNELDATLIAFSPKNHTHLDLASKDDVEKLQEDINNLAEKYQTETSQDIKRRFGEFATMLQKYEARINYLENREPVNSTEIINNTTLIDNPEHQKQIEELQKSQDGIIESVNKMLSEKMNLLPNEDDILKKMLDFIKDRREVVYMNRSGGAPADASYIVLNSNNVLTAERVLTAGTGITITDGGAGGNLTIAATGGGGGTPAGSNTQVQFNDGGAFGADAGLTYNKTTDTLTVAGEIVTNGIQASTSGGGHLQTNGGSDALVWGNGGGVNATAYGGWNFDGVTANRVAGFGASKTLVSLDTATYPSLTELSYVKGVTSGIQTQLDGKIETIGAGENITVDNTDPTNPVVASSVQSDPNGTILGSGVAGDEIRFDQPYNLSGGGIITLDDTSNYYHFASGTGNSTFDFNGVGRYYKADFAVTPEDPQEMRIAPITGGVIYAANQTFDTRLTAEATSVGSVATVRNNRGDLVLQSITGKWRAIDTVNGTKNIYGEVVCDVTTSGILVNNLGNLEEAPSGAIAVSFFDNDAGYVERTGGVLDGEFRRTLTTLTDAASIALNLASNNFYRVVLGGNRTLANPTNKPASGDRQVFILEVVQDGVGGRTLAFDTDYVLSVTPVLNSAANAVTHITCIATDNLIYVVGYA